MRAKAIGAVLAVLAVLVASSTAIFAQAVRTTTKFQIDPFWPKPLPHDWVMSDVGGVSPVCSGKST